MLLGGFATLFGWLLLGGCASLFGWLQARILNGVVQRAMHRLRIEVEQKIHRLPLSYFDRVQRGELLSRVTNDVDNIGQSLQQTLSQVVISLLTVIGVLVMMFVISPLLAVIALVTIPLTIVVTVLVARRSQALFVTQWRATGVLNARIEETFSGHSVVKVFGHQREAETDFAAENDVRLVQLKELITEENYERYTKMCVAHSQPHARTPLSTC